MKPVKMWAVFCKGTRSEWMAHWSIRPLRRESIAAFNEDGHVHLSWDDWEALGYTCRRVTVTPLPDANGGRE